MRGQREHGEDGAAGKVDGGADEKAHSREGGEGGIGLAVGVDEGDVDGDAEGEGDEVEEAEVTQGGKRMRREQGEPLSDADGAVNGGLASRHGDDAVGEASGDD